MKKLVVVLAFALMFAFAAQVSAAPTLFGYAEYNMSYATGDTAPTFDKYFQLGAKGDASDNIGYYVRATFKPTSVADANGKTNVVTFDRVFFTVKNLPGVPATFTFGKQLIYKSNSSYFGGSAPASLASFTGASAKVTGLGPVTATAFVQDDVKAYGGYLDIDAKVATAIVGAKSAADGLSYMASVKVPVIKDKLSVYAEAGKAPTDTTVKTIYAGLSASLPGGLDVTADYGFDEKTVAVGASYDFHGLGLYAGYGYNTTDSTGSLSANINVSF